MSAGCSLTIILVAMVLAWASPAIDALLQQGKVARHNDQLRDHGAGTANATISAQGAFIRDAQPPVDTPRMPSLILAQDAPMWLRDSAKT